MRHFRPTKRQRNMVGKDNEHAERASLFPRKWMHGVHPGRKPISNKPIGSAWARVQGHSWVPPGFDSLDLRLGTTVNPSASPESGKGPRKCSKGPRASAWEDKLQASTGGWVDFLRPQFEIRTFLHLGSQTRREQCHLSEAWTLLSFVQATRLSSVRERLSSRLRAGGAPLYGLVVHRSFQIAFQSF